MALRKPIVLISGVTSELPPSDTIEGASVGSLTAGSGLAGGGSLASNQRVDVSLAAAPSGLIFVGNQLGLDGAAQASGNAALSALSTKLNTTGGTLTGAVIGFSGSVAAPGLAVGAAANGVFSSSSVPYGVTVRGSGVVYTNISGQVGFNVSQPIINFDYSGGVAQNFVNLGAGSGINCSLSNFFTCTVSGNTTFTFNTVPSGRSYSFTQEVVHQTGTITWPTAVVWPGGTAPTLTTGKTHLFVFVTDDNGARWRGASLVDYTN